MKIRLCAFIFVFVTLVIALSSCALLETPGSTEKIEYDIGSSDFYFADFNFDEVTKVSAHGGLISKDYEMEIISVCEYSLHQCTISVSLYSENNKELLKKQLHIQEEIEADEEFTESFEISESVYNNVKTVKVVYSGKSYDKPIGYAPDDIHVGDLYTIAFFDGDICIAKERVKRKENASNFDAPEKDNYVFIGWYKNPSCTEKFDFSQEIEADTKVYAYYMLDAASITNTITTQTIKSVVTVYNKSYNKNFFGFESESESGQGSGVILNISNGYCYVLTNCHVAKKKQGYDYQTISVEDCNGITYNANIYKNPNKSASAIDAKYDLAIVYFEISSSAKLNAVSVSQYNSDVGADLVSIGSPEGQQNAISFGKNLGYDKITLDCETYLSNVEFDVIIHDLKTAGGSSGGPIFNSKLELVGIHYAGTAKNEKGAAIPAKKISEFLNEYVYE